MIGKNELARIHILKKEMGITDEDYRSLLSGAAGVDSAAEIETPDQYYKVITALRRYLLSTGKLPAITPSKKRMLFENAVRKRAGRILKDKTRLDGYLQKMGRQSLGECSE
ncbi:MAG: regulatory protein GemA [Treponema sp.]|jgi:hypothetical protein|nr:regulatory protein GemA [Treponema sp.]